MKDGKGYEQKENAMKYQSIKKILSILLVTLAFWTPQKASALSVPIFSYQMEMSGTSAGPSRVANDSSGNIYVADESYKQVIVLDQYGNRVQIIGGSDIPRSIAVDAQKRIIVGYLTESQLGYVAIFDSAGQFQRYLGSGYGEFGTPGDIAVSYSTGKIYVLDSVQNTVKVYDSDGNKVAGFGRHGQRGDCTYSSPTSNPGKFDFPSGIAVDDIRQEVLVSDQNNYRVQIFDMNGTFKSAFGSCTQGRSFGSWPSTYYQGKFSPSIRGLTVDKEGRIYVADAFEGTVQVLDRTGAFLAFIGRQGSGAGQLDIPVDVTIDNQKRLIIADWNNRRLTLYQIDSGPAINNLAPQIPVQVSPAHATQVGSVTPALTVRNAVDPNGDRLEYMFQVDTRPDFPDPVELEFVASEGSAYTAGILPRALTDHTLYYWRVKAKEVATPELYTSNWSGSLSFYVNALNRPPSTPTGLMPAAGTMATKTSSLSWGVSTDPDLYDTLTYAVEISDRADFATILLSPTGLGNNSVRLDTISNYTLLKAGITYYWRVRAIDNHGASSAYSSNSSFVYQQTMLRISSTPQGAKVYLGGNYGYLGTYKGTTGATPLDIADIEPGRYVIRVEKAGYFGWYTSVLVTRGSTQAVSATLTPVVAGSRPFTKKLTDEGGTAIGNGFPPLAFAKPFFVDWNNDGMKDLLVGDGAGRVYLYENISTDASPVFRVSTNYTDGVLLAVPSRAAPFAVDWNNDGRKDLIVGCGDGTVRVYLNEGSDEQPNYTTFSNVFSNGAAIQASGNAVPFVIDWNNDGKKDLLVGEGTGKILLCLNSGSDEVPAYNDSGAIVQGVQLQAGGATLSTGSDAVPFVTDWNNDGKKDLLVGGAADMRVYLNTGADEAPSLAAATAVLTGSSLAPQVLDYANDGYTDLLSGDGDGNVSYYQFKVDTPAPAPGVPTAKTENKKRSGKGVGKVFKKLKFW